MPIQWIHAVFRPVNTFFIHVILLVWNKKWFPQLHYNYPQFTMHVLNPTCAQESRVVEASKMLLPPCCMVFCAPCANWPTHYLKFPENYSKRFLTPSCPSGRCRYWLTRLDWRNVWIYSTINMMMRRRIFDIWYLTPNGLLCPEGWSTISNLSYILPQV